MLDTSQDSNSGRRDETTSAEIALDVVHVNCRDRRHFQGFRFEDYRGQLQSLSDGDDGNGLVGMSACRLPVQDGQLESSHLYLGCLLTP